MNANDVEKVKDIARRNGWNFNTAANYYMLYGAGELAQDEKEREDWNAAVERKNVAKKQRKL